ncbi:MAG: glycoside hydrolase family 3 C-terminal domain-containing protein [Ilumatobacter sp.]|uniref:glycoside hydrolase family 3 C-terminal domain-containing protein n=1 Tax=Ilumatobacter sp. TaxID=1967498 RepID=UPI003C72597E
MTEIRQQLAELPLERQVALLSGASFWSTEAIPELGLTAVTLTDGPHGVRRQPDGADHLGIADSVPSTCFPTASCLASSWDPELLDEVGAALGREARSGDVAVLLGPGLNIKRHPGGGRNFEYFSEDPLLSGRLAAGMIRGIQSTGVAACPKHFVANNLESYRMVSDSVIDERTLRELYLRGFEIAVSEGRPRTIMTSYNLVNGEYVADSERLLQRVLRDQWGFDGLVVTDWGGIGERVAGVRAGVDLEMPGSGGAHDAAVVDAVTDGDLDPDQVLDRAVAVARLLTDAPTDPAPPVDEVEHHRLARRAAIAGTVLLTNDGTLPLDASAERALDVAIIGRFAAQPRYQGAGSSQVVPTRLDDARRHLEERLTGRVRYASGYDDIPAATELAGDADVAVVFVGLPDIDEAEGYDRTSLALPPEHDDLVTAVCAANPNTVVVLANGAPVLMPWADRPAAVVEAYLGGQASGSAITSVLVGDAEPGGRLAESFPASMVFPSEQNFAGSTRQVQYREGLYVGYRFHDAAEVAARFPFGHGMSYTNFEWSDARVDGDGTDRNVHVTITNTGDRAGSDVVQIYVRDIESTVYRPDRELRGFAKVHLAAGASTHVEITLDERSFAYFDVDEDRWRVESGDFDVIVARSSVDVHETIRIEVAGETISIPPTGARGPGRPRYVSTATEFEQMLGHGIPRPVPVLPFTIDTVIAELDATRLGRLAQRGFLKIADRQTAKMLGDDPDPVLRKLSERMIREAPLRFLVSMSGGTGSVRAFDGLTKLLSALRVTGRRS